MNLRIVFIKRDYKQFKVLVVSENGVLKQVGSSDKSPKF